MQFYANQDVGKVQKEKYDIEGVMEDSVTIVIVHKTCQFTWQNFATINALIVQLLDEVTFGSLCMEA